MLTFPKYQNVVYHESSDWDIIFSTTLVKEQKICNNSSKIKIIQHSLITHSHFVLELNKEK